MKILLLGYMGSGKSTVSKRLAQILGLAFYDLDEIIESFEGCSISEIFKNKGEIYFRKIESQVLKEFVANRNDFVLALGGGTPCYANNHEILKNEGIQSFYLKGAVDTLFERLESEKSERPLIAHLNANELEDYIRKHLFDRSYYYFQAKQIVSIDFKSIDQIVLEIEKKLR